MLKYIKNILNKIKQLNLKDYVTIAKLVYWVIKIIKEWH